MPEPQRRSQQPGSPPQGPRAFSARRASRRLPFPVETPGPTGHRCARSTRPSLESDRGVLSSPRLASLSQFSCSGPPYQAPPSRGTEAARLPGVPPHRPPPRRLPVHGARIPDRSAGSSRAAHSTPAQRRPHQRPAAQLQPRRGSSIFGRHVGFRPVGSRRAPAA
ncbi:hypothetical protein NDU88_004790 [Pleurodeles waltl]|uniref:Uncharacterized protein n=1 Tax=Pleurodeles waltl TaxID=8319 RepID=A0AAV7QDI2_PLEWA|nr:hypothetical protein NDU88_004790 [Pleurodeles waltl]